MHNLFMRITISREIGFAIFIVIVMCAKITDRSLNTGIAQEEIQFRSNHPVR